MRIVRFILELLPRLLRGYRRLCGRVASNRDAQPAFYLSTLFLGPLGLYLWEREISRWWRRIPVRLLAYAAMLLAIRVFFLGFWILWFVFVFGWLVRLLAWVLRLRETRDAPEVTRGLTFSLTRLDKAALVFVGVLLFIFFLNRDQLMPAEDSDHNYHMAVARQILDQKKVPMWDDWEYAPAGRPHLYPPGLHLAIALFAGRADKIVEGLQTLQVLTYPLALFLTWWFIRWLFGPRMGLLGALIFSMDMLAGWTMVAVLPSAVVTAVLPLLLMCFLTKRKKATVILLALSFYTHLGLPPFIVLGLFLFSARHRGYFRFFQSVLTWSLALWLPWFLAVLLPKIAWLGMPSTEIARQSGHTLGAWIFATLAGLLMLQTINPILLVLQLWGLFRFKHPAAGFLRHMLFGFLPVLLFYGGRYWMHTGPIWAVFVAATVVKLLPEKATVRRIVVLALCTMIPVPMLFIGPGLRPRLSVSVGGAAFALGYAVSPVKEDTDFTRLAAFIEQNTTPREIVHVDAKRIYLGDRIVHATGRRVDVGGWAAEVRNPAMRKHVEHYRNIDTDCLFVYERADVPTELNCREVVEIGRFRVGIRGKTRPLDEQTHPDEAWPAD